jgi:hypothetical protein
MGLIYKVIKRQIYSYVWIHILHYAREMDVIKSDKPIHIVDGNVKLTIMHVA